MNFTISRKISQLFHSPFINVFNNIFHLLKIITNYTTIAFSEEIIFYKITHKEELLYINLNLYVSCVNS